MGDETACQRDALRLSAGHLSGTMTFQAVEFEPLEPGPCRSQGLLTASPVEKEWERDVLLRGELRAQFGRTGKRSQTDLVAAELALPFAHGIEALRHRRRPHRGRNEDARKTVQQASTCPSRSGPLPQVPRLV